MLLAAGCSSKNPDALTGMNVDENLAIMNADENLDSKAAETTPPEPAAPVSNRPTAKTAPAQAATADGEDHDVQANDIPMVIPDEPATGNETENNQYEPHGQF
jgi:hypothetical protein